MLLFVPVHIHQPSRTRVAAAFLYARQKLLVVKHTENTSTHSLFRAFDFLESCVNDLVHVIGEFSVSLSALI